MRPIAALGVILVLGDAVVACVMRRMALYLFERLALAFILGAAALSVLWLAFSGFYGIVNPLWLLTPTSLAISMATRRSPRPRVSFLNDWQWIDLVLTCAIGAQIVAILFASLRTPLGWDGLFNFEIKARFIFENVPSGRFPLPYLSDASRIWSHPQYPLMVPFVEYWIYAWLGRIDQTAIKIIFPVFYACLVALTCGVIRRISMPRIALATGVALGLLPPLTVLPGAVSGYAEVPLAASAAGGIGFTFLALKTRDVEPAILAGLLLAVAAWTKAEGILLFGCVVMALLAVIVTGPRTSAIRIAVTVSVIPLLSIGLWMLIQRWYGLPGADFVPVSVASLANGAGQARNLINIFVAELLLPGHWGLLWPAWAVAIAIAAVFRIGGSEHWFLVTSVTSAFAIDVAIFFLSAWADPLEHARLAVTRLIVPLAPVALMFTIATIAGARSIESFDF
jgi:hypothetical protein